MKATFGELVVLAGKAGLLALYLLALLAGLRRHDWTQTAILVGPVTVGLAWRYRAQLAQLARLDHHPTTRLDPDKEASS